jgi:hypothetical protein
VVPGEPHVRGSRRDQGGGRVGGVAVNRRPHAVPQLFEAAGEHGRGHRREIGEVRVDRRRGDARVPGDTAQGESRLVTRLIDEAGRRRHNLVVQPLPAAPRVPGAR